jgi:hypothetical protein
MIRREGEPGMKIETPAAKVRLYLLGSFRLERDSRAINLPTRKVESLLAYLALFPQPHSREHFAALLIHYGQDFEQIAKLFDHVTETYVWAHDLVTLHYSDDATDYPALFQLWEPVDLEKLEQGLRAAQVPLQANKVALKESAPAKWRGYLLGVWQRRQKHHPEIRELYDSKLVIAQQLLQQWSTTHPDLKLPVTFDNWFTQPAFCRFLDQTLHLPYVGTLAGTDKLNLKTGQTTLDDFAAHLKQEHLDAV